LQTVKLEDFNDLRDIFIEFWNIRDEDYKSMSLSQILYTYKLIESSSESNSANSVGIGKASLTTSKFNRDKSINTIPSMKFKGLNFCLILWTLVNGVKLSLNPILLH